MLDNISHSKTNSCQPYEGESCIPEFPGCNTSAVLCEGLSLSLSARANDTAGQETLKLTTSSLFSLKQPCQAAKHTVSLSLSPSLSAHRHKLVRYTQCPASCMHLPSRRVESREKVLTHMLDLASGGLKYIKGKHLPLTENEVNNSKTGSNEAKKLEGCPCQH